MFKKYKPGELTENILSTIADELISSAGYFKPSLPRILGGIIKIYLIYKKQHTDESKVKRTLNNLEKREIIAIEKIGNSVFVSLKDKGKQLIATYSIKSLLEYKKKKHEWNGKWFLVFFDVPEIQRNKRNYLRRYLLKLGFYPYQQSVYLFPYECENEIKLIKQIVEGAKYMKYIIAEKIEDESQAKIFFNLH